MTNAWGSFKATFLNPTALSVFFKLVPGAGLYLAAGSLSKTCVPAQHIEDVTPELNKDCAKHGYGPEYVPFKKPTFQVAVIYTSHLLSLGIFLYLFYYRREKLTPKGAVNHYTARTFLIMSVPSLFDVISNILCFASLMMIPASLTILMKGSRIFFASALTVVLLRKKKYLYHLVGVTISMVGIFVAGLNSVLVADPDKKEHVVVGIAVALCGEFIRALRSVIEESLMGGKDLHPTYIHGTEAVYGLAMMAPLLVLADQVGGRSLGGGDVGGQYENFGDTWYRMGKSGTVMGLYAFILFAAVAANLGGIFVIYYLSAVHNALISESRALLVWVLELFLHYCNPQYGKKRSDYFYLELIGFTLVIFASFVYNGNFRIPGSGGQEALLARREARLAARNGKEIPMEDVEAKKAGEVAVVEGAAVVPVNRAPAGGFDDDFKPLKA